MPEEKLGDRETAARFGVRHKQILDWERIFLAEGPDGFARIAERIHRGTHPRRRRTQRWYIYGGTGANPTPAPGVNCVAPGAEGRRCKLLAVPAGTKNSLNLNPLHPFTIANTKKKTRRVSGAKAGAAILSLFVTGIHSKVGVQVFCAQCGRTWEVKR